MAMLLCGVWPSPAAGQWQQADQVERGIQRGIQSLLARITPEDTIQYRTKKKRGQVKTVQGHVIKDRGGILQVKTRDGKRISVRKRLIIEWHKSGFVRPEMSDLNETGPSALVAFALISAGVETTHPRMRQLIGALANHNAKKTGTYVHSLRASVWSLLLDRPISQRNKKKYRRLLKKDVNWLIRGMG
ncbi:MAG: hypothetical protein ACE5EQ_06905, partial [Phycisphaerae bacterium]